MWSKKRHVIVMGKESILRCGFFWLVEEECRKKEHLTFYSDSHPYVCINSIAGNFEQPSLGIICLGYDDFFPVWFCRFLALLRQTNGNVLIFRDSHKLLGRRKKSLLERVCCLEHILDVSMPVDYISFLLEQYIVKQRSLSQVCRISAREISVIDGFIKGTDAACHSAMLGIDTQTLYQHRKNCANKLGVRNLKELLRF